MTTYENVSPALLAELHAMAPGYGYAVVSGVTVEVERVDADTYELGALDRSYGPMLVANVRPHLEEGQYLVNFRNLDHTDRPSRVNSAPGLDEALYLAFARLLHLARLAQDEAQNKHDAFAV